MKKNVIAIAMAALMAASMTACSGSAATATTAAGETTAEAATTAAGAETTAAASEAEKPAGGKLIMATNAEFPPYEFHDGDKIVGIDAEIAEAIAKEMGMELEIEDISFDSIIPAIQSGKADFGAAGMTVTDERKENVDFSDSYATATQVIIVKEGSDITGVDSLTDKTIGVQQGTTGDIYATGDYGDDHVERYNKGFEAVQALMQDKVDAVIIDGEPAKVFASENEGLQILDEAYTQEEYAIAIKKGNTELVDGVNAALKTLKESGELQKIVDKYITAE